ncbi:hypothetical protein FQA39_LY00068 [Lamprigera yunnana]|nr:hypothetical protein FQA39_LY00068 [Lamprigera yunnana]
MVLTKEYRICMPITVAEYQIGQLYMIARHSLEQSGNGEGIEVVENNECFDPKHGKGRYTEKRIHLSSRLPYWIQSLIPKIFYVTEKAWNYYPFTVTEYTCSFLPRFYISIQTTYENNNGTSENSLNLTSAELMERTVEKIDIAYDELSPKHYKDEEDLKFFQSKKTHRGPLVEGWQDSYNPIMCSYKIVKASFEVWGLQTRVEEFLQSCIREILLLGHRQAFAWIDDWIDMSYEDVRKYENSLQEQTNNLLMQNVGSMGDHNLEVQSKDLESISGSGSSISSPVITPQPSTPKTPVKKGQAFTIMLVYIWSRRNPFVRMNFFGLLNIQVPYLPWLILAFSILLGNAVYIDLIGIVVGHIYYFIEDVFPHQRGGFKILKTPMILKTLFDHHTDDPTYAPLPEDRPGGFDWGNNQPNNNEPDEQPPPDPEH